MDCDDTAAGIRPNAVEDGEDAVDNDCNGTTGLRRAFTDPLKSGSAWTLTNATHSASVITVTSTGGTGSMVLNRTWTWPGGQMNVDLGVSLSGSSGSCTVGVKKAGSATLGW